VTNTVLRSANENGFIISTVKTKAMLIYPRKPRVGRKPKMKIRIGSKKNSYGKTSSHPGTSY
jgi:hypothetical protein